MRKSTKIRKIKLPACGCQTPAGVPCGCANIIPNPTYNCGCPNQGMCGCPNYWDQMDIPSCSLEMANPFAMEIPYTLTPETCVCRSGSLPYDYMSPIEAMSFSPCGCGRNPCGCQMSAIQPTNIYDFLSYMDLPYGNQNVVKVTNCDYIPCGCGIPQCGCQVPRDGTACGCRTGTIAPNYFPSLESVTAVFPGLGVPYTCGCDGSCYMSDVPCGCQFSKPTCNCQASTCNCGCQRCGFGCGCGCGSGCECGGKYLRQITLQPPFL